MSKPSAPRQRAMGLGCLFMTMLLATAVAVVAGAWMWR
jgi:hypothetical protein